MKFGDKLLIILVIIIIAISCKEERIIDSTPPVKKETIIKTMTVLKESDVGFDGTTEFTFNKLAPVKLGLSFVTVALGRESKFNAGNNPTIILNNNSYTHPSIVYIKNAINGYNFWLALTPYFGKVFDHADFTSFENPHIFASNDGINWVEHANIKNPIDTPFAGPFVSYWSDPNLTFFNNQLYCFYRGNGFPKNFFKDKKEHFRNVVYKTSLDGVNWSNKTLLYSTDGIGLDSGSGIVSPTFVYDPTTQMYFCYDVVFSTNKYSYKPQGNQLSSFVMRRSSSSPEGPFLPHGEENICNFLNKPWPENHDPWHLEIKRFHGMYFILLNTGLAGKSNGESLFFGYSKDGINFKMVETPLFASATYKSTMLPVELTNESISFYIYQSDKRQGEINLYKLDLEYSENGNK